MENDEKLVVYSFPRIPGEEIQASIRRYRGKYFADLRLWYMAKNEKTLLPTKKGVAIGIDKVPELKKAIDRLSKAAEKIVEIEGVK